MRARTLWLSTILVAVAGTFGSAAPVASLVRVPISDSALMADPTLQNFQSWDLRVTVDPGFHWANTGIELNLTQGTLYNSQFGGMFPETQLWDAFPQVRFDTFLTQAAVPANDSTYHAPIVDSGFPAHPAPVVFNDTRISVAYAFTPGIFSGPGTFTVARLTWSDDAVGGIVGFHREITTDFGSDLAAPFAFAIPVPEAGSAGAILCGMFLICRRGVRRTRNTSPARRSLTVRR